MRNSYLQTTGNIKTGNACHVFTTPLPAPSMDNSVSRASLPWKNPLGLHSSNQRRGSERPPIMPCLALRTFSSCYRETLQPCHVPAGSEGSSTDLKARGQPDSRHQSCSVPPSPRASIMGRALAHIASRGSLGPVPLVLPLSVALKVTK